MSKLEQFQSRPVLTHLKRLTTKDGVIQHADNEVPDPSFGYSIDDNARALIACLWHYQVFKDEAVLRLAEIYFQYIQRTEKEGGSFHNFLSYTEKFLDAEGSEDSIGRAIWALGETIALAPEEQMQNQANEMLKRTNINRHMEHPHVRTKAYILLGLLAASQYDEAKRWADKLVENFNAVAADDWQWFEDSLRYANGIIPYALAKAAHLLADKKYLVVAQRSFDWLDTTSRVDSKPAPIGQDGWYFRGQEKSVYDQQPLDAADMVLAAVALFEATQENRYLDTAGSWMSWYEGHNNQSQSLINTLTGGIFDAITPTGVNKNQGAESIVTYLMAYLELSRVVKS